jgi:putative ATP-dependent endonuclease of OLD family
LAISLKKCKFDVLVFCDDDNKDIEKSKQAADADHVKSVRCKDGYSIEEQLFEDLPWDCICQLVEYVINENPSNNSILSIQGQPNRTVDELRTLDIKEQKVLRPILGKKAKQESWYKRIDHGEFLGKIWIDNYQSLAHDCILRNELDEIRKWIGDNIE